MKRRALFYLLISLIIILIDSIALIYFILAPASQKVNSFTEFKKIIDDTKAIPADLAASPTNLNKEITVYGYVIDVLSRDVVPPRHERFIITLNNTRNLTVMFNIDYLGRGWINVAIGDWVVFTGELINFDSIHKVGEGGGFLILYRNSSKELLEVGFYGIDDVYTTIGLFFFDILFFGTSIFMLKRKEIR